MAEPDNRESREGRKLRPSQAKEGVYAWLDDVLFGGGEVTVLALPTMVVVVMFTRLTTVKSAAAFSLLAMVLAVGTLRGDWVEVGAPWPDLTARVAAFRTVLYGAIFVAGGVGGALVESATGNGVLTALAAMAVPLVLLAAYPHYARWRRA